MSQDKGSPQSSTKDVKELPWVDTRFNTMVYNNEKHCTSEIMNIYFQNTSKTFRVDKETSPSSTIDGTPISRVGRRTISHPERLRSSFTFCSSDDTPILRGGEKNIVTSGPTEITFMF